MSDKTLVILKSKDGRRFEKVFDSYEDATLWISENTKQHGIELSLEAARFDREPTIEIYSEKSTPAPNAGDGNKGGRG